MLFVSRHTQDGDAQVKGGQVRRQRRTQRGPPQRIRYTVRFSVGHCTGARRMLQVKAYERIRLEECPGIQPQCRAAERVESRPLGPEPLVLAQEHAREAAH